MAPPGRRGADGRFRFQAGPGAGPELRGLVERFCPNRSPAEVLQAGAFGGTYFRDIESAVTGRHHRRAWAELPPAWLRGLDVAKQVARPWSDYAADVNKYGVKCGNTLEDWEKAGWMQPQDPYGWFQWYCRFFRGRRTGDDARQINRWLKICGPTGRWKGNLVAKCLKSGKRHDDPTVAPVVRQSLLHWGYELTAADYSARRKDIVENGKGAYALPKDEVKAMHKNIRLRSRARKRPASAARAAPSAGAKRRK